MPLPRLLSNTLRPMMRSHRFLGGHYSSLAGARSSIWLGIQWVILTGCSSRSALPATPRDLAFVAIERLDQLDRHVPDGARQWEQRLGVPALRLSFRTNYLLAPAVFASARTYRAPLEVQHYSPSAYDCDQPSVKYEVMPDVYWGGMTVGPGFQPITNTGTTAYSIYLASKRLPAPAAGLQSGEAPYDLAITFHDVCVRLIGVRLSGAKSATNVIRVPRSTVHTALYPGA
jgi:hypothetical protein